MNRGAKRGAINRGSRNNQEGEKKQYKEEKMNKEGKQYGKNK